MSPRFGLRKLCAADYLLDACRRHGSHKIVTDHGDVDGSTSRRHVKQDCAAALRESLAPLELRSEIWLPTDRINVSYAVPSIPWRATNLRRFRFHRRLVGTSEQTRECRTYEKQAHDGLTTQAAASSDLGNRRAGMCDRVVPIRTSVSC